MQESNERLVMATKDRMALRASALTVPSGDGSGFQWLAVMPLGLVFLALTLPALALAASGRLLWPSLVLGCLGLLAFALLWKQLLNEFDH